MNTSGEAADQVLRMTLEGTEAALKITGKGAEKITVLLYKMLKDLAKESNKTQGQMRLANMIKSGKKLEIFEIPDVNLKKFCEMAKTYGIVYTVLKDKKRVRKYGAFCTGITQNVDDLLQSYTARTMLANSEFVIMLNQASTDRVQLAELMGISDTQLSHITNVEAGCGLMKVGSALVPFINKFPHDTKLYRLMTTKPGETV